MEFDWKYGKLYQCKIFNLNNYVVILPQYYLPIVYYVLKFMYKTIAQMLLLVLCYSYVKALEPAKTATILMQSKSLTPGDLFGTGLKI